MYLKALEMQGFKSFSDKTVLRFDKGMTAVVGPNGSGKSNISDAVLWVLGEQSVKSLRSSKMEDVIFSGTATRRPMGFAEVTLLLDNHDRKAHFDADEIAVTRRYYRSGESEYQLNGKTARLKDIHELFMDTGLGRDGYSMVGQGRIESIVSAKSTDRREIFEEAAGISHYRYRRTDALKRLEQAEDNLLRLRDIASELENRLGPLEKQSEKAQQFLALAAERKDVQIGVWLYRYDQSAEMLRRQAEKTDIAKNQYDETLQQAEALFARSREGEERARAITVEIESIRRAAADSEQKARDAENEAKLFSERIKHNEEVLSRIARETGDEENTDRALRENQQKAKAELDILENEIDKRLDGGTGYTTIDKLPDNWASYDAQKIVNGDGAYTEQTIRLIKCSLGSDIVTADNKLHKKQPELLKRGLEEKAQAPNTVSVEEYEEMGKVKIEEAL